MESGQTLEKLLHALDAVAEQLPVIFPVHPRTRDRVKDARVAHHRHLRLIPPIGYFEFLCLLDQSRLVLTDSGGIQEETTALGVPNASRKRDRSQLPKERISWSVKTPRRFVAAAREILAGKTKRGQVPQLWDGHAAARIVEILL